MKFILLTDFDTGEAISINAGLVTAVEIYERKGVKGAEVNSMDFGSSYVRETVQEVHHKIQLEA